jgi:hypothetical protein
MEQHPRRFTRALKHDPWEPGVPHDTAWSCRYRHRRCAKLGERSFQTSVARKRHSASVHVSAAFCTSLRGTVVERILPVSRACRHATPTITFRTSVSILKAPRRYIIKQAIFGPTLELDAAAARPMHHQELVCDTPKRQPQPLLLYAARPRPHYGRVLGTQHQQPVQQHRFPHTDFRATRETRSEVRYRSVLDSGQLEATVRQQKLQSALGPAWKIRFFLSGADVRNVQHLKNEKLPAYGNDHAVFLGEQRWLCLRRKAASLDDAPVLKVDCFQSKRYEFFNVWVTFVCLREPVKAEARKAPSPERPLEVLQPGRHRREKTFEVDNGSKPQDPLQPRGDAAAAYPAVVTLENSTFYGTHLRTRTMRPNVITRDTTAVFRPCKNTLFQSVPIPQSVAAANAA